MSRPTARYAVCERVLRQGSFAEDVALTRAAGIGAIGVDADAVDAIGVEAASRILDGEGIQVSSYMGLEDILQRRRVSVARRGRAPARRRRPPRRTGRARGDGSARWANDGGGRRGLP